MRLGYLSYYYLCFLQLFGYPTGIGALIARTGKFLTGVPTPDSIIWDF